MPGRRARRRGSDGTGGILVPVGRYRFEAHPDNPGVHPTIRASKGVPGGEREAMEAELFTRAQGLQRLDEELREAHDREHRTALTLQEAVPRSPDPAGHRETTVRCTPATRSLDVCGDWYDVVGHGLEAAVMSMLRSALSAVVRAIHEPGRAMDVLGGYARTFEGASATTAVKAVTDALLTRLGVAGGGRDHIALIIVRP